VDKMVVYTNRGKIATEISEELMLIRKKEPPHNFTKDCLRTFVQ